MLLRLLLLCGWLALATGGWGVETPAREMPFTVANGFLLLKVKTEAGEPLTLLLDSGASVSVLDLQTARRLGLRLGAAESVLGVDSRATAFHLEPLALRGESIAFPAATMAVDLRTAAELCGTRIDGLAGVDFFAGRAIQLDFAARRLRLLATGAAADGMRLPISTINGVFCVPISVNGSRPRWVRLDTGCNDPLHWVVPRVAERARRGTSLGFVSDARNTTLAEVRLGHSTLREVEASLHGHPLFPNEAGLLGTGLLQEYLVTIDALRGEVVLGPQP